MPAAKAPTWAPIRKLKIGGFIGFLVVLTSSILDAANSVPLPASVISIVTFVATFGTAYLVRSGEGDIVEPE